MNAVTTFYIKLVIYFIIGAGTVLGTANLFSDPRVWILSLVGGCATISAKMSTSLGEAKEKDAE